MAVMFWQSNVILKKIISFISIYTALLKQVYLGKLKKLLHTAPLAEENHFNSYVFSWSLLNCSYKDNWQSQFKWVRWPMWSQKMAYITECSGSISLQENQKAKAAKAANLFKSSCKSSLTKVMRPECNYQKWSSLFICSSASWFAGVQKLCFVPKN